MALLEKDWLGLMEGEAPRVRLAVGLLLCVLLPLTALLGVRLPVPVAVVAVPGCEGVPLLLWLLLLAALEGLAPELREAVALLPL